MWAVLKKKISYEIKIQSLIIYFEEYYVLGKEQMHFRNWEPTRSEPLFSIEMWSVYSRTLNDLPQTFILQKTGITSFIN